MQHNKPSSRWRIRFVAMVTSMTASLAIAQNLPQFNGIYSGQINEVTKSRQPPCSPAQAARVVVKNGEVIMPSLLLGAGQASVISARIESDGSFTGKLVGAEMRGKIVGSALSAKIIVPLRCVYDVAATRQ